MAARRRNLATAVRSSTRRMSWLADSDRAAVDLAVRYAEAIEAASANGSGAQALKALGWLGPQLLNTLKSIGGTPADRAALGVEAEAKGRLAEIRALRSVQ